MEREEASNLGKYQGLGSPDVARFVALSSFGGDSTKVGTTAVNVECDIQV